jgi:hypothetical protein
VSSADVNDDAAHPQQMSVSVRLEAELVSGRRVLLLDDRGWSTSVSTYRSVEDSSDDMGPAVMPDIWAMTTVADIVDTARIVVGPDEPSDGSTHEDVAASHWAYLAEELRQQGIVVEALELSRLPHDVVLSDALLARLGRDPG